MVLGACKTCGNSWSECECKKTKVCIYSGREIEFPGVGKIVEKCGYFYSYFQTPLFDPFQVFCNRLKSQAIF